MKCHLELFPSKWLYCISGFKTNCPLVGSGHIGGVPTVRVFVRVLARLYVSFRENYGKLRTARSTSVTEVLTWHLPSSSLECYHSATGGVLVNGIQMSKK